MILLRPFTVNDRAVIREKMMPGASDGDVDSVIAEWQTKTFNGSFFEMLALTANGTVVGSVSLYERSKTLASVGIEVFPEYRGEGYAYAGMLLMLESAAARGYRAIMDRCALTTAQASLYTKN
ncbi:MAG: GNAT family N-acetyltransferase [Clostridia bacterium]|nr:GNAT family N-acetyltransferase [Clostridia bacterium]